MKAYNVEVFDKDFAFVSNTAISSISCSDDYLAPETNSITVPKVNVDIGNFILITRDDFSIFGIVSGKRSESKDLLSIEYKSFLSLLDMDILFDTNFQNSDTSLEEYLSRLMFQTFSYNEDPCMNISGVMANVTSETKPWTFELKGDDDYSGYLTSTNDGNGRVSLHGAGHLNTGHYCVVNLLKSIIIPAFKKYSVRINAVPNFALQRVVLSIGVNSSSPKTIEADLPNIIKKNVMAKKNDNVTNKVIVYNTENYDDKRTFYLHDNGSFDQENRDRILPVIQEIRTTAPYYEDDVEIATFEEMAISQAYDIFSEAEYNNLIELTMAVDDTLYNPTSLGIGQVVNVISDDKQYTSILSGYSIDESITLIFGVIRVDLTKIIWRSSYGY